MLGAIIGDLAGSIYEYDQITKVKPVKSQNIIEDNSFISDDTILTMAIADAIINNIDYESKLKEYAIKYANETPKHLPYFESMFSPGFIKWAKGNEQGKSFGNGAMMRVSPIGYFFDTEEDVIKQSYLATIPSHNTKESIECAQNIALIILYSRQGMSKEEIINKLNLNIVKPKIEKFNYTCSDTIDVCLYSLFKANNFEESICLALSFGGDTDTNACIVGSMAEAMFGVPNYLKQQAMSKLPNEFNDILTTAYSRIKQIEQPNDINEL